MRYILNVMECDFDFQFITVSTLNYNKKIKSTAFDLSVRTFLLVYKNDFNKSRQIFYDGESNLSTLRVFNEKYT